MRIPRVLLSLVVVNAFYCLTAFAGTPLFQSASDFTTGLNPGQIATGDFNRDGKLDMAVANQGFGTTDLGSVTILLGNGNGTFQPATNLTNGLSNPASLAAGDLNEDGKLDLAVLNLGAVGRQQISILLGNGDGTFQNPTGTSAGGGSALLTLADLNQDGHLDLVATIAGQKLDGLSVSLGNGDGTFQSFVLYRFHFQAAPGTQQTFAGLPEIINIGDGASFITVADLNHDGKPDVAEANLFGHVAIFLNSGNGTLNAPVDYATGMNPQAVIAADLNGDGSPDLAAACYGQSGGAGSGQISVLLNNGDGAFTAAQSIRSLNPGGVWAADFNGDGKQDLAFTGNSADTVTVASGNGDGTFRLVAAYAVGSTPQYVTGADFTGDGKPDLVVTSGGGISLLLAKSAGFFAARDYSVDSQPLSVAAADFNGDHIQDIAVGSSNQESVNIFFGTGNGTFQSPTTYLNVPFPIAMVSADLSNDGVPDLVSVDDSTDVVVLLNNGDGTFQNPVLHIAGFSLIALAVADFNGDGNLDVVAADNSASAVFVLLGDGHGGLSASTQYKTTSSLDSVTVNDFNGDDKIDIAAYSAGTNNPTVSLLFGKGDGTFQKTVNIKVASPGVNMVSGDFNLDGKADLALLYSIIGPGTAQVQVMLGNGDGTFNSSGIFDAGLDALSIAVADFNGDGKPDLAVTGIDLQVLAGKGDGTFSSPAGFDAGITPRALGVADFNGDAKLDVAVGNFDSKNVTVLLHK